MERLLVPDRGNELRLPTYSLLIAAVALALSVPILGFAIWTSSARLGIGLMAIGAGVMSAALAPIDAARPDIVHPSARKTYLGVGDVATAASRRACKS